MTFWRMTMASDAISWHRSYCPDNLTAGQQAKKIDDKALKAAAKGTEWAINGMDWAEQRYSTMTQINPANVGKLAPVLGAAPDRRLGTRSRTGGWCGSSRVNGCPQRRRVVRRFNIRRSIS
jgi:hypothetical protein